MWPVSDQLLAALRTVHDIATHVDVTWPDGTTDPLPVTAGAVSVEPGRRSFTCDTNEIDAWRDVVLGGATLRPYRGVQFTDGTPELAPLGVFEVRATEEDLARLTPGKLSAPDRRRRVQQARYLTPAVSGAGRTYANEWARQLQGALPAGLQYHDLSGNLEVCPYTVWQRDRDEAVDRLAEAAACEWGFDQLGDPTLRPVPKPTDPADWTIDTGDGGVLLGGSRRRSDEQVYNVVVVTSSRTDGVVPFAPVIVEDLDPSSPTYVLGPYGRVPRFYANPLLGNARQAFDAGQALLRRAKGPAATVQLTSLVNPALDSGDVLDVRTPDGRVERHVVDAFTVDFDPEAEMQISTRAMTLPDEAA